MVHHYQKPEPELIDQMVVVEPEAIETVFPEDGFELEDYSPSIELLKEAGILNEIEERPLVDTLKPVKHSQSKLSGIVKALIAKRNAQESEDTPGIFLEPLRQTTRAVFQTQLGSFDGKTMGQKYAELVKARQLSTAFVGPDNRIIEPGRASRSFTPESDSLSNFSMMTNKKFPCTSCGNSYTRACTAIRHMIKVHNLPRSKVAQEKQKIIQLSKKINKTKRMPLVLVRKLGQQEIDQWTRGPSLKLAVKKLSNEDIEQWTSNAGSKDHPEDSFALALKSLSQNVVVSLPKLSPSKLPKSNDEDDDSEVILNPNKRSRSSSPSSSSSKEENPARNSHPPPSKFPRKVLSNKTDINKISIKREAMSSKEAKNLIQEAKSIGISMHRRTLGPRRKPGPASVMNNTK